MNPTASTPAPAPADAIIARARELPLSDTSVAELIALAADERRALEAARDKVAAHVHAHVDDFEATGALRLLNKALSAMPRTDPLDWRVRWHQRFRKP